MSILKQIAVSAIAGIVVTIFAKWYNRRDK
ncbi:type I toxin-antitoxin system Fst family toxin [Lactovum odontotermitis]